MAKAMTLVGLDVHARQTHAAVLDPASGELAVSKLRMAPEEVVSFLAGVGPAVRAVYEATRAQGGEAPPARHASGQRRSRWTGWFATLQVDASSLPWCLRLFEVCRAREGSGGRLPP